MFLSKEDLRRLTGSAIRQKQRQWLINNGYPFEINAAGDHIVLASFVNRRLGGPDTEIKIKHKEKKLPNLTPQPKRTVH
jgi:hypothetical protein